MNHFITAGRRFPGNETIYFQDDDFGHQVEAIIIKIRDYIDTGKVLRNSHDLIEELSNLIFARLGLKTEFIVNEGLAAIIPFYHNSGHIFLSDWTPGEAIDVLNFERLVKKSKLNTGTVDASKAKVTGIFSEYVNQVYMNFEELLGRDALNLTTAECTAVLLHELGHGFHACEYATRQERCNQVLADIARSVQSKEKKKELTYVYREVEELTEKNYKEEIDIIVNGGNVMTGVYLFKLVTDLVKSQMVHSKYDETSFEALADNFATRFGYGRELVTALDALYGPEAIEKSTGTYVLTLVLETIMIVYAFGVAIGTIVAMGISLLPLIVIGIMFFAFFMSSDGQMDMTYDVLKHRYKRVRQAMIEQLKDSKLDKDRVKNVIKGIQQLDEIISETRLSPSLYRIIGNILYSSARTAKNSVADQKLVEELAANDLFLKAAQLRTI